MTLRPMIIGLSLVLAVASFDPAPVLAQEELTAEEIETLFNRQLTRGLVIVPSNQEASGEEATTVLPETSYVDVARPDQVNIQISFDFDSAALREDQKPKLVSLCQAMKSVQAQLFQIVGHTDSSGSAAYNQSLSLLRAQEVKRHMVDNCGLDAARLKAIGVGESSPFDPDDTRSDVNRRVEFQALS